MIAWPMTHELWLLRPLMAGGALLLLAWLFTLLMTCPARKQRLAAWAFRGAVLVLPLCCFPAWVTIPTASSTRSEPQQPPAFAQAPALARAGEQVSDHKGEQAGNHPGAQASDHKEGKHKEGEAGNHANDQKAKAIIALGSPPGWSMAELSEPPRVDVPDAAGPDQGQSATPWLPFESPHQAAPLTSHEAGWPVPERWCAWLMVGYGMVSLGLLLHFGLALWSLRRLCRASAPVAPAVEALAAELAEPLGVRPHVRTSGRLATAVCFGWRRPTIVLPEALARTAHPRQLRWMLAHELDHLRRGDPATGWWVGLARAIYFVLPWFWLLRRDLRLTQEYLADAAAAGDHPADYAEFLVSLSHPVARGRVPLGAVAVRAGRTDLYRRIAMLTHFSPRFSPLQRRGVSRLGNMLLGGCVFSAAVAFSSLGFAHDPAPSTRSAVVEDNRFQDNPRQPKMNVQVFEIPLNEVRSFSAGDDNRDDKLKEIMQELRAALDREDLEAARKLFKQLQARIADSPGVMMLKAPGVAAVVPPPPPMPPEKLLRQHMAESAESVKRLEKSIEGLRKAMDQLKDNPEAREAIERTIREFKKQLAQARERGELKGKAVPDVPPPAVPDSLPLPGLAEQDLRELQERVQREMEARRQDFERMMAEQRKMLDEMLKNHPEILEKLREVEQSLGQLQKLPAELPPGIFGRMPPLELQFAFPDIFGGQDREPSMKFTKPGGVGRLGATLAPVPEALVDQLKLEKGEGVLITGVAEGSPAARVGLKVNDVLLSINGKPVPGNTGAALKLLGTIKPGETVKLEILRRGARENLEGVLLPNPEKQEKRKKDEENADGRAGGGGGGGGIITSRMEIRVNQDQFTIKSVDDDGTIEITGTLEGDEKTVTSVRISRDGKTKKYSSLDDLPKEERSNVERLLKSLGGSLP